MRIAGEIALKSPESNAAKAEAYFEREILGAARNIEHGAALVRSGQAGSRPSHNQSSRATHSAHCRQQRQLPKRRARGMMIGPRHAVEEIAHPWEGGHSEASAALVAGFGPSNGTFKNAEPPRTHHRALACTQSQGRGCQRASDICMGRSGAVEAPTRSTNVTLRLHLGTSRTSFRSRISAHGGQGGRGREIHISRSLPHAAARMRVQARQRRP